MILENVILVTPQTLEENYQFATQFQYPWFGINDNRVYVVPQLDEIKIKNWIASK